MAGKKLRLEIRQSDENGECRTPRWYGQHAITTNDITGSVMKILITDSNGKRISITIGKNGGIRGIDGNTGKGGAFKAWIDQKNDSENSTEQNLQCIKEELIEAEEPETESLLPFNQVAEIVSEGYNLESLEPEVEEEFHTVMENIKTEESNLAGKFETVFINSTIIPESYSSSKPHESSAPISESDNNLAVQSLLCRLCASQRKDMVYIFGYNEAYKNIIEKIENCLSILVRKTDSLPNQVCRLCLEKLELCHKFRATVAEAEKQFIMLSEKVTEEIRSKEKDEEMYVPINGELEAMKPIEESRPTVQAKKIEEKAKVEEDIIFVGQSVADKIEEFDMIKCRICGRFFGTTQSLHRHSEVHYSENNFPCCMCESYFTNRVEGLRHSLKHVIRKRPLRRAEMIKQQINHNLPILLKTAGDKSSNGTQNVAERDKAVDKTLCVKEARNNQTSTEHGDDEDVVTCRICGVYSGTSKNCYMHSMMHFSNHKYPCSMCDKTFNTRSGHYVHSIEHTMRKIQQKTVEIPKKTVPLENKNKDIALLSSEEEEDNDENSIEPNHGCDIIKCQICGLYFGTPKSCYIHSETHYSENYYPCSMCDKTFTNRIDCCNHRIEHTMRNIDQRKTWIYTKQTSRYNLRSTRNTETSKSDNQTEEVTERDKADDEMLGIEGVSNDQTYSEQSDDDQDMVKCQICGRYFGTAKSCCTHSKSHATENHLPCGICGKVLTNEKESRDHGQEHIIQEANKKRASTYRRKLSRLRPKPSPITGSNVLIKSGENVADKDDGIPCNVETVQKEYVADKNLGNVMIKCRICGMDFKNVEDCCLHANVHVQKDCYPCTMCNKEFTTEADAKKHNLEHTMSETNEKSKLLQICNLCGEKFSTEDQLEFHKIHHSRRRKTCYCNKCDKIFLSESNLYTHILNTHRDDKEKYNCKICGKEFRSDRELKNHQLVRGERPYKCCLCGKKFLTNRKFKLHRLRHYRFAAHARKYSCIHCGLTFARNWSLTIHMKTHEGERRYSCKYCSRTYTSSQRKDKHEAAHVKMRWFICKICKKRFTDPEQFATHQNTHLEKDRPYGCFMCDRAFRTSKIRKEHIRAVHLDDKRYKCDICGKKFMRPSTMRIHKRTRHQIE